MMNDLANEAKKRFLGTFLDDVLGYWRLYDRLKIRFESAFGEGSVPVRCENDFWYSVLGDRYSGPHVSKYVPLRSGQVVSFKDCFLSEWVPKLPGRAWTIDGARDRIEGLKRVDKHIKLNGRFYEVLDPYGKEQVVQAGWGSVRLKTDGGNKDQFACLNLVTAQNFECDLGIPVIVSKPVYEEFYRHARRGAPSVQSAEGILYIGEDLPVREVVPSAIGAALPPGLDAVLRYRPFLPKCYLYIASPLSIRFAYNDSHPGCVAWTLFEGRQRQPYRYTYTHFDPNDRDSTEAAVGFLNWYVSQYDGERILTDFDGKEPKLEARVPLAEDPMTSKNSLLELDRVLNGIDTWAGKWLRPVADRW